MDPEKTNIEYPAVVIHNLSKNFGEQAALTNIHLSLEKGKALCLCGPNAAGKTTLIKIISTVLKPTKGDLSINGVDAEDADMHDLGVILDKASVYSHLTAWENLNFFAELYGIEEKEKKINLLLERTQLAAYRNQKVNTLSRGTTQRLAIARALLLGPTVLCADEPFMGLDDESKRILIDILTEFKHNSGCLILASHHVTDALKISDHAAVLDQGRLIFVSAVDTLDCDAFCDDYLAYARQHQTDIQIPQPDIPSRIPLQRRTGQFRFIANIIKKDLFYEFRTKQLLPTIVMLGIMICWIFRLAADFLATGSTNDSYLPITASVPLLISTLFAGILVCERNFMIEKENDCFAALAAATSDISGIYIAKLLTNTFVLCLFDVFLVLAIWLLFDIPILNSLTVLILTLLLFNLAVTGTGTLFAGATINIRMSNFLLSIVVMSTLLAAVIPAVASLARAFTYENVMTGPNTLLSLIGNTKKAIGFLAAFDVIFITASWLLFEYIVED